MSHVMKADASVADAYAHVTLGVAPSEFWLSYRVKFEADALALWIDFGAALHRVGGGTPASWLFPTDFGSGPTWWDQGGSTAGGNGGVPVAGSWLDCELHVNAGVIVEFFVNGVSQYSFAEDTGATSWPDIYLGIMNTGGGANDPASVAYFDEVKLGTTRGGSDLFSDGFESGTFDAWTSTSGDVSIVEDSPVQILARVFSPDRFYEAPPWRIIVSDLDDVVLTGLDKLAMDRSITITRNAARVMGFRVPSDNPEVNIPAPAPDGDPFVHEGTRLVSYFRRDGRGGSADNQWKIHGRGIVLDLTDSADGDTATSTIVAYDPWKYLYRRPMLLADGSYPGDAGVIYPTGTRASDIILEQFAAAEITGTSIFIDYNTSGFWAGTIENTDPLPGDTDGVALKFAAGTSLGEMLDVLVATGTCDIVLDPVYDVEPGRRPGILCDLSVFRSAGEFKPQAIFGWDRWPRNAVQLTRQIDGTARANQIQMFAGQGGPPVPLQTDAVALAKFGDYWAQQYLPGVTTKAAAEVIAQRQLALIANGQKTYSLSPAAERAPVLFDEYREHDTVPLVASKRFRQAIEGETLRIESIPVVIGDDQLERINAMLVSAVPETGS